MTRAVWFGILATIVLGLSQSILAQGIVNEALTSFPPATNRVEFSSPSKLRKLPNYQALRQRYVGPRLLAMESSLAQLGIREEDID